MFICLCFILQLGRIKRSKVRNVTGLHRTGKMGGVNLSINKMEFSLAISQLLLVQLGKFVDTIIFEIVGTHYCM